ncbi:hypothetical protein XENOCAPTIV_000649 [Xenoophorus captivus]|uniref:Secreted protein n=1 Tax=Xenoophorus captivus TaxID=1517983 RepID=A0ABV0RUB0_9TELE
MVLWVCRVSKYLHLVLHALLHMVWLLYKLFFLLGHRVSICGYPRQQLRRYKGISTRLTVTSEFLVQLITGIHYALCNGEVELGSKALDDVLYRAQLELFPEALLVGASFYSVNNTFSFPLCSFQTFVCARERNSVIKIHVLASVLIRATALCPASCSSVCVSDCQHIVIPQDYIHAFQLS